MNWKSILVSAIYFLVLLLVTGSYVVDLMSENFTLAVSLIMFVWLSPGYLAAYISKRSGVMNASLSGLLVTAIAMFLTFILNIGGDQVAVVYSLLVSTIIWFGLGAVIWYVQAWLVRKYT